MLLKVGAFVAAFALLVGGLAWLSRIQALAISSVNVSGNIGIESADVQAIANKHLAGTYAALFPRANKILYPKEAIEQDLKAKFPSIEALTISTEKNELDVTLTERKPAYVWCKGTPSQTTRDECYFMDITGYIFSEAPQFSGDAYFSYYGLLKDESPIGKTYLNINIFTGVEQLREKLNDLHIPITSYFAKDEDVREIYFEKSGKIIFKATQDLQNVASSVELLTKNTSLLKPESLSSLEYLDLRFGNKVYYKLYGDNAVQSGE